jgi:hypothetical protein
MTSFDPSESILKPIDVYRNPWIDGLSLPKDDSTLIASLAVGGQPVGHLEDLDVDHAVEQLSDALKKIHVPSTQEVVVVRRIVGLAVAHAARYYVSDEMFMDGASSRNPLVHEATIVMLTSLAGYGKSQIAEAISRLLKPQPPQQRSPLLPPFPIVPFILIKVDSAIPKVDVLNTISSALGLSKTYVTARPEDILQIKLRLYQRGCCFIIADELQFLTRSDTASTRIVQFLGFLNLLGVPIVYVCNYSLGHRLLKRPHEDRDRLMSDPMILIPEASDDSTLSKILKEFKVVFNGRLDIDPNKDAEEIHAFTFNLRRYIRRLLTFAYKGARQRRPDANGTTVVTMVDVRLAYLSTAYESDRKAVLACQDLLLGIKGAGKDMVCPFQLPQSLLSEQKRQAVQLKARDHAEARVVAAMTQSERKNAREIAEKTGVPLDAVSGVTATKKQRRPIATKGLLLASLRK